MPHGQEWNQSGPFSMFLEEEPRAAFFGQARHEGFLDTPGRRRQAGDIYEQAMQGFYSRLGEQALQGQAPTLQFRDYVSTFPFSERFAEMGRQYGQQSRYRPPTRRLFF